MRGVGGRTSGKASAGHELVDHTSEVTLRLWAPDYAKLIDEATSAFAELVPDSIRGPSDERRRDFLIQAPDPGAALVDWLNEIVYLCEADQWLPIGVDVECMRDGELRIQAGGESLGAPFVSVKAATLHGVFVRDGPEGLEAEVTLDV